MKRAILLFGVLMAAAVLIAYCAAMPVAAPSTTPPTPLLPSTAPPATTPVVQPPLTTAAPVPASSSPAPVALAPCPLIATRTPPPGAPTYVPGGPNPPRGPVDPHIELCGTAHTIRVGETVTLTAKPVDIGLPYFALRIKDDEQANYTQVVQVTYDNRTQGPTKATTLVELVSANGSMYEATFIVRALRAGTVTISVTASGEIHYGYPGPATYAGGASDPMVLGIVDR